jgi:hypothetical protein
MFFNHYPLKQHTNTNTFPTILSSLLLHHISPRKFSIPTPNYKLIECHKNPPNPPSPQSHTKAHIDPMKIGSLSQFLLRNLLDDWVDYTQPFTNMNYLIPLASPFW